MSLASEIEEAISSPLDTSIDESVDHTPIPLPERVHYPTMPPIRPRLVSQLTRSTLPTATLTHATPHAESSAMARRRSFPDLDPVTGLPPERFELQRTITDVLRSPVAAGSTGLGSVASVANFSTSASDWWGWWGNKGKVDRMMSEEDQAPTVEEEREQIRRKCRSHIPLGIWC